MYHMMRDSAWNIHFLPVAEEDWRQAPRPRRPRPPRRGYGLPYLVPQVPSFQPPPPQPVVYNPPQPQGPSLDMRTGLKAIGAILPGLGQLLGAFRNAPERPQLSGDPNRDLPRVLDFIADHFDRERTGAQTAGVLATTGAVMEILATL